MVVFVRFQYTFIGSTVLHRIHEVSTMREIKFRAFDKSCGEFVTDYDTGDYSRVVIDQKYFYLEQKVLIDQLINGDHDQSEDIYFIDQDNIELMQYTGLKDKNGVEIYEGDIVRAVTCKGDGVENLLGVIAFDDIEADYCIEQNDARFPVCSFCVIDKESFEVIGNIYENKELL